MIWKFDQSFTRRQHEHIHDGHQLTLCMSDTGVKWIRDKQYPFKKHATIFIPEGVPHFSHGSPDEPAIIRTLVFNEKDLVEHAGVHTLALVKIIVENEAYFSETDPGTAPANTALFDQAGMELEPENFDPFSQTAAGSAINRLLINHFRCLHRDSDCNLSGHAATILACCRRIAADPAQKVTLSEMARSANMSRTVFAEAFKRTTGSSLITYTNTVRIHKAALLLMQTDLPIQDIGLQVGYESSSHFYDQFKRIMDVSPRRYRMKHEH